ncbi:uncharacterized protein LOC108112657 isoform X2 [Drosophila eugracilis]|uniref:uncharacterized protein LOC108112657 isoform X2 n=1 Tax=Drosophila eugracilis TaxID=29029 RepID=UPI0007E83636|nr:uncharacterized protein LOC108112657 isoform X2 [Drosophila eugracilis]
MVRPTLISLAKRVPLITFRKGGAGTLGAQAANQQLAGGPAIEDYELPARFARKRIDPEEAAYINNGGVPN